MKFSNLLSDWLIQPALAQKEMLDEAGEKIGLASGIRSYIALGINGILGILGIVSVIIIIWAGFKYMTAAGNADEVKKAKSMLFQAAIGLIIILTAYSIASFVFSIIT